jgi:hypothetical protein
MEGYMAHMRVNCYEIVGSRLVPGIPTSPEYLEGVEEGTRIYRAKPDPATGRLVLCEPNEVEEVIISFTIGSLELGAPFVKGVRGMPPGGHSKHGPFRVLPATAQVTTPTQLWVLSKQECLFVVDLHQAVREVRYVRDRVELKAVEPFAAADFLSQYGRTATTKAEVRWLYRLLRRLQVAHHYRDFRKYIGPVNWRFHVLTGQVR